MNDNELQDYRQWQADERRMYEESIARYYAANPRSMETDCPLCHERLMSMKWIWQARGTGAEKRYHETYVCEPCYEAASDIANEAAIRKAQDNVHTMGNTFGTQKWERHTDANGNIIETVRVN